MGVYVWLIVALTFFRPLYLPMLNRDIRLSFVATSEHNDEALASNVRINHITVNGKDLNLANISLDNAGRWKYDSENDFLYVYDLNQPEILVVDINDVHSLSIGAVKEVGSGIIEIFLNEDLWKTFDLYQDSEWAPVQWNYESSIWVFPERYVALQVVIFGSILLLCVIARKKAGYDNHAILHKFMTWTSGSGLLAVFTQVIVCILQYGDFYHALEAVRAEPQSFLKSVVLIFILIMLLTVVTGKLWLGYFVTAAVIVSVCIISNNKLLNKGVPLLPWDFSMIKEAASVIQGYEIVLSLKDAIGIVLIIGVAIALYWFFDKKRTVRIGTRLIISIPISLVLFVFLQSSFVNYIVEANNVDYRIYQVDNYYKSRGIVSAFFEYCTYFNPSKKPEQYDKDTIREIENKITNKMANVGDSNSNKPTIIAIMSESFWDIERLNTLNFTDEVFPNFHAATKECKYGEIFTHVLNGGTVTSEFEFLTGFSGEFFPLDYMVYGNFLTDGFESAVSLLKNQGYLTSAFHPYIASNYNREEAYQKFGFDQIFFEDDFEPEEYVRGYISDSDLFAKLISEYKENKELNKPQFLFSVTMQNHGGYWGNTINVDSEVDFTSDYYGNIAKACISDYVAGLHESDRALGELINYFQSVDEEIVVIYFGDHMSDAGPKDDRMLAKSEWVGDQMTYDYETHRVPFLIWSNFDKTSENLGMMEAGELMPTLFELFGIKSNYFWKYLQMSRDVYQASDGMLFIDSNSNCFDLSKMSIAQKEVYDTYQLLQYDYIWGNRYASSLWQLQ